MVSTRCYSRLGGLGIDSSKTCTRSKEHRAAEGAREAHTPVCMGLHDSSEPTKTRVLVGSVRGFV